MTVSLALSPNSVPAQIALVKTTNSSGLASRVTLRKRTRRLCAYCKQQLALLPDALTMQETVTLLNYMPNETALFCTPGPAEQVRPVFDLIH